MANVAAINRALDSWIADPSASPWQQGMLCIAARRNDVSTMKKLMSAGMTVDDRTSGGSTSLHIAVNHRNGESVNFLLNAAADVNAKTVKDVTPLMVAANTWPWMVEKLLEHGANPLLRDDNKKTARDFALDMGHFQKAAELDMAEKNASINSNAG